MQIIETLRKIASKLLQCRLWKLLVLLNHLEEITASAVLEDNPEVIACFIPVVEFEDVPVLQVMEDSHLYTHDEIVVSIIKSMSVQKLNNRLLFFVISYLVQYFTPAELLDRLDGNILNCFLLTALYIVENIL